MVKHIVFWRLKDSAHGNDRATNARLIKHRLEGLRGRIPGLLSIEVGVDFVAAEASSHLALYCEFVDKDALAAYQAHPEHQAIVPFVVEAAAERRMVGYEA